MARGVQEGQRLLAVRHLHLKGTYVLQPATPTVSAALAHMHLAVHHPCQG